MKLEVIKLKFLIPAFILMMLFSFLVLFSLTVYSNYILVSGKVTLSLLSVNKSAIHNSHSLINQSVVSGIPKDEEIQTLGNSVTYNNNILTIGGDYSKAGNSQYVSPPNKDMLLIMNAVNRKWKSYESLLKKIASIPFMIEKEVVLESPDPLNQASIVYINKELNPHLQLELEELNALKSELVALYEKGEQVQTATSNAMLASVCYSALICVVLGIGSVGGGFLALRKKLLKPLEKIASVTKEVANGNIDLPVEEYPDNLIGKISQSIHEVIERLRKTSAFASDIGKGHFNSAFEATEHDELGKSLLKMRDNLIQASIEDKKRKWAVEGLAMFGNILRSKEESMEEMAHAVLLNLIKYLQANQGSFYVIEEVNEESVLSLKGCYAYGRKKVKNHTIHIGEGLVGQAVLEKDIIYLTEIPQDYIKIRSGLGEANPNNILVAPLLTHGEVLGVIEIASFNKLESFEIEFVQKLTELIAASISSLKVNERTKQLLEVAQQTSEELRAREEEMRQSLEELEAIQEQLIHEAKQNQALHKEINKSKDLLNMVIDAVPVPIFAKDRDHKIILLNKAVCDLNKLSKAQMLGKTDYDFFQKEEADVFWNFEEDIFISKKAAEKLEYVIRNGRETYTLDKKIYIETGDGEQFLVGVNIDVTELELRNKN